MESTSQQSTAQRPEGTQRQGGGELRLVKGRTMRDALLAARPAGGYPDHAPDGSLESYVATSLWWHIRGSIGADDAVSMDLIENKDNKIIVLAESA